MTRHFATLSVFAILLASLVCAQAQTPEQPPDTERVTAHKQHLIGVLQEPVTPEEARLDQANLEQEELLNELGISFRLSFGLSAKFKNVGGYRPNNPGKVNTGTNHVDHFYDDGYNRVDNHNNEHFPGDLSHATWFWGYNNASQYNSVANTMQMHSSGTAPATLTRRDDDPQKGFEILYRHEFGKIGKKGRWGFEATLGYSDFTIHDSTPISNPVIKITDTYSLAFSGFPPVVPPAPPYHGNPQGSQNPPAPEGGPLMSDLPSRAFSSGGLGTVNGFRDFDADIFEFRLGPYVKYPLTKRLDAYLSGGLAVGAIYSDYSYKETVTIPGIDPAFATSPVRQGRSISSGIVAGPYLSGNLDFQLYKQLRGFGGVQWEDMGTYTHTTADKAVDMDLSSGVHLTLGVAVKF